MEAESSRPKHRENTLSLLNVAIEAMNLAKEFSSATPAKAVFSSVSVILTMIRVRSLFCYGGLRAYTRPGLYGQRNRLRRARASLCQCV